jgi:PIN domain nuclease of toxin-antitoxin system
VVLDASALLAFLLDESGADAVAALLPHATLSAVNYCETLTKSIDRGKSLAESVGLLTRLRLSVVPFDAELAAVTASLRPMTKPLGLSLGDRACLALGLARNLPVVTADRAWAQLNIGVPVQCVR